MELSLLWGWRQLMVLVHNTSKELEHNFYCFEAETEALWTYECMWQIYVKNPNLKWHHEMRRILVAYWSSFVATENRGKLRHKLSRRLPLKLSISVNALASNTGRSLFFFPRSQGSSSNKFRVLPVAMKLKSYGVCLNLLLLSRQSSKLVIRVNFLPVLRPVRQKR